MGRKVLALAEAFDFAAERHAGQTKKSGAPFIQHLIEVTALLSRATRGRDQALLVLGVLHDTLEKTETTRDEIVERFGATVAELVEEVTDDEGLSQEERTKQQIARAPNLSKRAKRLKLADKTSNLRDAIRAAPERMTAETIEDAVRRAEAVVAGLRGVDAVLEAGFDEAARAARETARRRRDGA